MSTQQKAENWAVLNEGEARLITQHMAFGYPPDVILAAVERILTDRLAAVTARAEAAEAKIARVDRLIRDVRPASAKQSERDGRRADVAFGYVAALDEVTATLADEGDTAESIGDSVGVPELANRAWSLAGAIRRHIEASADTTWTEDAAASHRGPYDTDSGRIDNWSDR